MSAEASSSTPNGDLVKLKLSVPSREAPRGSSFQNGHHDSPSEPDEPDELIENPDDQLRRVAAARQRHEADLLVHHYEAPKADTVQNEWVIPLSKPLYHFCHA